MNKTIRLLFLALSASVVLFGCNADHSDAVKDAAAGAHDAVHDAAKGTHDTLKNAAASVAEPAVVAVLAKADGMDGTTDMIVAKCPGCALAMEGSADHAMSVGDYELHFCSEGCKDKFAESPAKSILALEVE